MTINDYLDKEIKDSVEYEFSPDERKMLELGQISQFITEKLTSKKFRKNNLSEKTKQTIAGKVKLSVTQNKPIYLIFGFGGYKGEWIKNFCPKVEWAELFMLTYLTKLLTPIAQAYKPGVFYEFEAENAAVIEHNNYTKEEVGEYDKSFKALIEFMHAIVPNNLRFNYITLFEQYDTKELFDRVKQKIPAKIEELKQFPKEELERMLRRTKVNLKFKGTVDYNLKTESELNDYLFYSLAFNHLFLELDYEIRANYFNGDERIMTVGAYCTPAENPDNWITTNSCARSSNAFWTSAGVLEKNNKEYTELIIGPEKYSQIQDKINWQNVDTISSKLDYLNKIPIISL